MFPLTHFRILLWLKRRLRKEVVNQYRLAERTVPRPSRAALAAWTAPARDAQLSLEGGSSQSEGLPWTGSLGRLRGSIGQTFVT